MIFGWHSGQQALVFVDPTNGQAVGIKASDLRANDWLVNDVEMARELPRVDARPQLSVAHDMAAARAMAKGMKAIRR